MTIRVLMLEDRASGASTTYAKGSQYDLPEATAALFLHNRWATYVSGDLVPNDPVPVGAQIDPVTGGITVSAAGRDISSDIGATRVSDTFVLAIGSDHTSFDRWGKDAGDNLTAAGRGYMQVLLDAGVKPYLAVTTSPDTIHAPDAAGGMGWDKLAELQRRGVEILSHGHAHIQRWDRLNAGIFIQYNGFGTGTVQISATQIILTGAGGAEDATLTRSSYTTIADVVAAIAAVTSWTCNIPDSAGLLGTEPSSVILSISGSRNVKGTGAGDGRYFCCGGGLHVWCGNSGSYAQASRQVYMRLRSNGYMEVFVDGVRQLYTNLASATFSGLATTFNAALNAYGVYCQVADNGQSDSGGAAFRNYMRGDELASILTRSVDWVVSPGNVAVTPTVVEAGLGQRYLRDRQFAKSVEMAAANGVTIRGFAEPGDSFFPWHMQGHDQFDVYRGTIYSRVPTEPVTYPLAETGLPTMVRSSCLVSQGFTSAAHMTALADAMADSPGHACCILWHGLGVTGGDGGYELGTTASDDQLYVNAAAFLARIKTHTANGKITPSRLSNAARVAPTMKPPKNWLFNPKFKNAGSTIAANTLNNLATIPGWRTSLSNTAGATLSVDSDGYLVVTSSAGVVDLAMEQSVVLKRGRTYEFGFSLAPGGTYTAGNGVSMEVSRLKGRWLNQNAVANQGLASPLVIAGQVPGTATYATAGGGYWSRLRLLDESQSMEPARVLGIAGPYNIGAGNNQFSIRINGVSPTAALTLTTGAARTAQQIADEINAWLTTDATFSQSPEFFGIAAARKEGRSAAALCLIGGPTVNELYVSGTVLANTSAVTLFGGTGGDRYLAFAWPDVEVDAGLYAVNVIVRANIQGVQRIGVPYLKPMEMM